MKLRDLEYITAIDRYLNFGRAAEACNVSQPALSAQVKKLEERLGVEIFARNNQKVIATEAGHRIIETAKDMLKSARQIKDYAAEYRDPLSVPLKIGIFPTLAPFIVPYVAGTVKSLSREMDMVFRETPTRKLISELQNRRIDIAMVSGPVDHPSANFTPVFRESLLLAVSKNHRLANRSRIDASEIISEELILLDEDHCLREDTLRLCDDKNVGIDMPEDLAATSLLTATHYITQGFGSTLLPALSRDFLGAANPDIRMVEIDDPGYGRTIGFLSRKGCPREHILMALCDKIRSDPPSGVTAVM
ncbi:LysR family transcriptional regulator, hydrogen peroxide-inducible genes activator [Parasphingorhabdus marina DSM 22363]|uniref:LysR family transcriptional regulator, hydrogen peroxide-inducible genes activator n=1 Tax=Parasphingorhabdus marina DSM 22363 TaxID=1123272 RepID=A0A1N6D2V7_9SPHN|nr:LysR substrate-binding domain-containing protein [Parasphingorhabdus marina]SIN65115.1 LysR family transcriptional regulator, hydrogen peroxide-inducible genes activator [Parasphingorhabdus marina DSM 22363]